MRAAGTYLLQSSDRRAVDELRLATLVGSPHSSGETLAKGRFIARPEAVQWSDSDDSSRVFGMFSKEGTLLSTLRAELLKAPEELPPKLDYDHLHAFISLPCGLLGKASTRRGSEGQGFNTYLRYLAYQEFHRQGVQHVVGTLMPDAPRIPLLRSLGYEFLINPEGWRRFGYQSFGPTLVCYLDLQKNYERVLSILEPKVERLKFEFPYVGR